MQLVCNSSAALSPAHLRLTNAIAPRPVETKRSCAKMRIPHIIDEPERDGVRRRLQLIIHNSSDELQRWLTSVIRARSRRIWPIRTMGGQIGNGRRLGGERQRK